MELIWWVFIIFRKYLGWDLRQAITFLIVLSRDFLSFVSPIQKMRRWRENGEDRLIDGRRWRNEEDNEFWRGERDEIESGLWVWERGKDSKKRLIK